MGLPWWCVVFIVVAAFALIAISGLIFLTLHDDLRRRLKARDRPGRFSIVDRPRTVIQRLTRGEHALLEENAIDRTCGRAYAAMFPRSRLHRLLAGARLFVASIAA